MILAPGVLIALRTLLPRLGIQTVTMGPGGYYTARDVAQNTESRRPESESAHVWSPVSWNGRLHRLPSAWRGLLIADASHLGATGFSAGSLEAADIVVGDLHKWLAGPWAQPEVAFVAIQNRRLRAAAIQAFAPFYLALEGGPLRARHARWLRPESIIAVDRCLQAGDDAESLCRRHEANLALATRIASSANLTTPRSALVMLPPTKSHRASPVWLKRAGGVWKLANGRARITCRADWKR